MKSLLRSLFAKLGILNIVRIIRSFFQPYGQAIFIKFPPYNNDIHRLITARTQYDYVRHSSIAMALQRLRTEKIPGVMAECGVWRGDLSVFLHRCAPERRLYLFDTFEGFPTTQLEAVDERFRDASEMAVRTRFTPDADVHIRKGIFPDTALGLEEELFAFVMIDFDIYVPTLAALEFFYPRLAKGAYVFIHDVNSPESDNACMRAVTEFLRDKPEKFMEIPDVWGSVVFRKV